MQRPSAPEGEQHEIPQIVAAHGRDRFDGLLHLDVDDADDTFRRCLDRDVKRARDLRVDRCARTLGVKAHAAAEEIVGTQKPERQIAVCDRRQFTAAVTGGTGHGAGTLRTDFNLTDRIHPRDRPAAGTHGVDLHCRNRDVVTFDFAAARYQRLAAFSKVDMPPFDCMTYFCGVATPAEASRWSRLPM